MKNNDIDLWKYETEMSNRNYKIIAGIDEAGRGPLCGPVCAAAVILPLGIEIKGLNDSKKLSEKQRESLYPVITENAVSWAAAFATPEEIDELNILNATFLAMRRAVDMLNVKPDILFIDGNRIKNQEIETKLIVKGDSLSASIAAASVIAKVTRDRYMCELDKTYPQYLLSKHKGYPTKEHYELLAKYGIAPFYRKTFLKNIDRCKQKKTEGKNGEEYAVAAYAEDGFETTARNYRYGHSEIDLIVKKDDLLVAVEVKTRSSTTYGRPADFATDEQLDRVVAAAKHYRDENYPDCQLRFDIFEVYTDKNGNIIKAMRIPA